MHVELLEEAEMSQIENAGTSSSKTNESIEKGNLIGSRETENVCSVKKRIKQLMSLSINNLKMTVQL
jgi:hypothetical protein